MSYTKILSALLLAASLAACSTSGPAIPPSGVGSSSQMPQSPNSLPPGDVTAAPMAADTGIVGRTQVGSGRTQMTSGRRAVRRSARRTQRRVARRPARVAAPASTAR